MPVAAPPPTPPKLEISGMNAVHGGRNGGAGALPLLPPVAAAEGSEASAVALEDGAGIGISSALAGGVCRGAQRRSSDPHRATIRRLSCERVPAAAQAARPAHRLPPLPFEQHRDRKILMNTGPRVRARRCRPDPSPGRSCLHAIYRRHRATHKVDFLNTKRHSLRLVTLRPRSACPLCSAL